MESIVAQIKTLAGKDDATRKSVIDALIKLQHSLETPFELIMRLYNSVRTRFAPPSRWSADADRTSKQSAPAWPSTWASSEPFPRASSR